MGSKQEGGTRAARTASFSTGSKKDLQPNQGRPIDPQTTKSYRRGHPGTKKWQIQPLTGPGLTRSGNLARDAQRVFSACPIHEAKSSAIGAEDVILHMFAAASITVHHGHRQSFRLESLALVMVDLGVRGMQITTALEPSRPFRLCPVEFIVSLDLVPEAQLQMPDFRTGQAGPERHLVILVITTAPARAPSWTGQHIGVVSGPPQSRDMSEPYGLIERHDSFP